MSYQEQALKHELEVAKKMLSVLEDEIELSYEEFKNEISDKTAYQLRKHLSNWIKKEEHFRLLHKIYSHGWGQDDTRHE